MPWNLRNRPARFYGSAHVAFTPHHSRTADTRDRCAHEMGEARALGIRPLASVPRPAVWVLVSGSSRRSNSLFARPALMRPSCLSLSADRPGPRIRTDYSMFWSAQRVFTARHVAARITRSGAGASAAAEARPGPLGAFRGPTACKATRRRVSEVPVAGWATKSRRSRVRRGRSGGDRGAGYFTKRLAEDWPRDVLHEAR